MTIPKSGQTPTIPDDPEGQVDEDWEEDCPRCLLEWRKYCRTGIGAFRGFIQDGILHRWWICPNCGKRHYVFE